jgi:tetratricopeptide (TPR) repeat protein
MELTASARGAPYPDTFRRYIARGADCVLAQVQAPAGLLPHETRVQALHVLSYALNLSAAWPVVRDLLLAMAPKMEQAGYRDEWIPYLERGLAQSQLQDDQRAYANLNRHLGFLFQLRSKFEQARRHYAASAETYKALGEPREHAFLLNRLAYVARLQRRFREAEQLAQAALQLLPADDVDRATSYFVLGWVALDAHKLDEGIDYFTQSLTIFSTHDDRRQVARRLRDLATALLWQQRYEEALLHFQQADLLFGELQDPYEQAATWLNLGVVHLFLSQAEEALRIFARAEPVLRRTQNTESLAMLCNNQGIAYRQLRCWRQAQLALHESIALWRELENREGLVNVLDELGLTYLAAGLHQEATYTFHEALTILEQMVDDPSYGSRRDELHQHLEMALAADNKSFSSL